MASENPILLSIANDGGAAAMDLWQALKCLSFKQGAEFPCWQVVKKFNKRCT
jgi:hypothetical protein